MLMMWSAKTTLNCQSKNKVTGTDKEVLTCLILWSSVVCFEMKPGHRMFQGRQSNRDRESGKDSGASKPRTTEANTHFKAGLVLRCFHRFAYRDTWPGVAATGVFHRLRVSWRGCRIAATGRASTSLQAVTQTSSTRRPPHS